MRGGLKRWMRRWTQFGAATAALALGVMLGALSASRLGAGIAVLQGRYYLTARSITEPICTGSLRISGFPNLGWAGLRAARLARPLYPADVRVAAAKEIGAAPFWSKLTYLQPWLSDKFSRRLDGIWR